MCDCVNEEQAAIQAEAAAIAAEALALIRYAEWMACLINCAMQEATTKNNDGKQVLDNESTLKELRSEMKSVAEKAMPCLQRLCNLSLQ